jgi:hypothetical protein
VAVAFDAVGPSSSGYYSGATAVSSGSWSHTCSSSANRVLIVDIAAGASPDTGITCTATYNGVAMTSVAVVHPGGLTAGFIQRFKLIAPASGAHTVAFTLSGGTATVTGGSTSYTGADQTTGLAATTYTATGSSATASVAVSANTSGNIIMSSCADGSGNNTGPGTGGTSRYIANGNDATAAGNSEGATWAATGSSVTTSFGINSDDWAIISSEVLSASAGAPAPFTAFPRSLKGRPAAHKAAATGVAAPPPVIHPSVPSKFYPPRALLRGKPPPNTRTRTSKTLVPATAPPPHIPAPFYPPHSLLRGAQAAARGRLSGLRGQPAAPAPFPLVVRVQAIVQGFTGRKGKTFGQAAPPPTTYPSPPVPQHQLLHPAPHAGKGKLAGAVAPPPVVQPSVPAPFTAPRQLLRGARAAARGTLASVRGLAGRPSPFRLPGLLRPAATGAGRPRTTLTGTAAPEPAFIPPAPAPFYAPHSLLRPAPTGAHRGQGFRGIAPQPVTMPGVPSPFYAPHGPLRPASPAATRGRLTRTGYGRPGQPAPFTPPHGPLRPAPPGSVRPRSVLTGSAAPAPVTAPSAPAPFYPPHTPLRGRVPGRPRTTITGVTAPPPVIHPPVTYLGIWQGSTHMVAQNADNLILGSNHPGPGGPGDERGDLERSS